MILYYSGRVLLYTKPKRGILQRPEDLLKACIMLSYSYVGGKAKHKRSEDFKRFLKIFEKRKGAKNEN